MRANPSRPGLSALDRWMTVLRPRVCSTVKGPAVGTPGLSRTTTDIDLSSGHMTRRPSVAIVGLLLVALALPAGACAEALVGADSTRLLARATMGMWIFKAVLVLNALLGWAFMTGPDAPDRGRGWVGGGSGSGGRTSRRELIAVASLLVIAGALRLHALGTGLWIDEIAALVRYVRLPTGRIVSVYDSQNQHILYSLLARASVVVGGESPWTVRLPAALFGVGSLVALYWFGRRVTDGVEALLATALMAFSYHHVWFSQNARGYTGLLMWTLLGTGLFLLILKGRRTGRGAVLAYGAAMALATYTHASAALIVVAHGVVAGLAAFRERGASGAPELSPRTLWALVFAGAFSLQLHAIVLPQMWDTLLVSGGTDVAVDWTNPLWLLAESARGLMRGMPGGPVILAGAAGVTAAGLVSYARRDFRTLLLMILPAVLTVGVLVATRHNLWPRFFFFSMGFGCLLVIRGLRVVCRVIPHQERLAFRVATAALLVASASTIPEAWGPKQDFRAAREYVREHAAPDDAVVTLDLANFPYSDYLRTSWTPVENPAELSRVEGAHPRTWVLYTFPTRLAAVQPEIWERLKTSYEMVARFPGTVAGGAVVVKVRNSRSDPRGSESRHLSSYRGW